MLCLCYGRRSPPSTGLRHQTSFGVEITAPQAVSLERINELLASLGQPPLADHEFKPVRAA